MNSSLGGMLQCCGNRVRSLHVSTRTLVGAGLKDKESLRRPLSSIVPPHIAHVPDYVKAFEPKSSSVTLASGRSLTYDILVVATGLKTNWDGIKGLSDALADKTSAVSSIYNYETCDKTWATIDGLKGGKAIFTQPAGVIKCAGGEFSAMDISQS